MEKISALGLTLLITSIVTAAILPKHNKTKAAGILHQETFDGGALANSCLVNEANDCTYTQETTTTISPQINSLNTQGQQTRFNTSITDGLTSGTDSISIDGSPMVDEG